ncbi:MAG TPA: hypothetical protein VFN35_24045, partial [Ktedonobacteraceae bacterium]|nr:hypothetical protein [Ktedonobacteraceae bacterium]
DQQLRAILKGIYSLQQMYDLSLFLISYDAIHNWVGQARQNLYRVSAILEKPKISNKDQEERFKLLADCPRLLAEALEYFNI